MESVLLLNSTFDVLASVEWTRAVTLLITGEATAFKSDEQRVVRSKHLEIPFPEIVVLTRYVHVPYVEHREPGTSRSGASRRGVLLRDAYTCLYCSEPAGTIDHVFPSSRGGDSSWENLVAACLACNQFKADRTPEEAGLRLRRLPFRPNFGNAAQRKVWAELAALG